MLLNRKILVKAACLLLAVLFISASLTACKKSPADTSSETVEELLAREETAEEKALHKEAQKKLTGEWSGERDFAADFEALNFTVSAPQIINVKFAFTEDGKYSTEMDEEKFRTVFKAIVWESFRVLGDGVNSSPEYIDEIFKQYNNMTADEYVDITLKATNNRWNTETEYKLHGDKLYIYDIKTKEYKLCEYSFEGDNTLIITENGIKNTYTKQ